MNIDEQLQHLGPRLRLLREARDLTLREVAEQTDISLSTLSRLEAGKRKATLELLLPLTSLYETTVDELFEIGAFDPRVHTKVQRRGSRTFQPLSNRAGGPRAMKLTIKPGNEKPTLQVHDGYEWLYILSGQLDLRLGDYAVVMGPGEVAEFSTKAPHWLGCSGSEPVEVLAIFSPEGEKMHTTVKPKAKA